jgi:hypothetical protein
MADQHRTRDAILDVLRAEGRPLTPKQVSDALPTAGYPAIRKLMRAMLHGNDTDLILHQENQNGPYALLKSLDQGKLNAAPQTALYAQLKRLIVGHRHQRRTQPNDINEVLRRLLRESEASIHNVEPVGIQIRIVLPKTQPQPESPEQPEQPS